MAKIAIIDDDQDIVDATTLLLETKGYSVVSAGNVKECLNLISIEKPELIILDVMMEEPDDGFYLSMKLRKEGINTPIILLTSVAKATGLDLAGTDKLPIDAFLEKPVPPGVLLEKVKNLLLKAGGN